jgi:hypothetical protein
MIEKELESSRNVQPVFDSAVRVKLSLPPLTRHASFGLLQMGQAGSTLEFAPAEAARLPVSLSTEPPHAPSAATDNPSPLNPRIHQTTPDE